MLKRSLFFGNPYHLSTRLQQLQVHNKQTGETTAIPVEDIGFVILEHPQITFTQKMIQLMAANNVAVVFCDDKFLPTSMLMHLNTHQVQGERFRKQLTASEPLKKQLWQQTVKAKIHNQAALLTQTGKNGEALHRMARQVKSGDTGNVEAQAARSYWPNLLGNHFRRERYGEAPNPALNYGYAILRAGVARALAGSGLLPALGIHHRNKYNAFCLADDIMEPYRPYVDTTVIEMQQQNMNCLNLTTDSKAKLLGLLSVDVHINNKYSPLMIALSKTTASLVNCYAGNATKLIYPELAANARRQQRPF